MLGACMGGEHSAQAETLKAEILETEAATLQIETELKAIDSTSAQLDSLLNQL